MIQSNVKPDVVTFNTLIDGYIKIGNISQVEKRLTSFIYLIFLQMLQLSIQ